MKLTRALMATLLAASAAAHAASSQPADTGPSVAVQTVTLHKGSLPRTVTAYGMVGTGPAARQTIQAPVAAVVDRVYAKPGEQVAAQAPLLRLGPSPATASAYNQAITALRAANEDVTRTRSLLGQHLATNQQLVTAEKAAADARSALAALQAEGAGSPQVVRAPFAAIVTTVSVSPGAIVAQGAPLLELARPTQLVLHGGAMPAQAITISTGDSATIVPLGERRSATGQVVLVGSVVDAKTGLVPVDVSLPAGRFFAGEMARASIEVGKAEGYVVPHEAVLVNQQGAPYVVQAIAGRAKQVPVHLELGAGANDVISGPLDPNAPLVLAGNYQLTNGMKVRVDPPEAGK
ncbi:MAG TPA: efflux RND transporter periplasmic adaptor subunit [Stellaceae bacterium]|nr:efflux RND transporter periplasmic adaptor subunit [Stellaceae bacterium]